MPQVKQTTLNDCSDPAVLAFFYTTMAISIPILAAGLLVALAIYKFLIYPALFGPLAKIPNAHWSAPFSPLWIHNCRRLEKETFVTHEAHQRLGQVVRLAPEVISVNSVDGGIRTVYAGGYEKGDWYKNVFNNYGLQPMFAMPQHARHSQRRKMLSNIYAKSTLQNSEGMHAITDIILNERFVPHLQELAKTGRQEEFYTIFQAVTMDFVSAYVFGLKNSSEYLLQPDLAGKFFRDYKARQAYQFWPQDVPKFTKFMISTGFGWAIMPKWVYQANSNIESWIMSMVDKAEATVSEAEREGEKGRVEDWPNVYSQLRGALLKDNASKGDDRKVSEQVQSQRLETASEMLDHTLAGFDTSSITLTFLAYELSLPENLQWQSRLRAELATVDDISSAKALDALPILQAILMECLRLHAAIPGNQPRITPPNATIGPYTNIPANIRVQAQAWSLHREPSVFPDPLTFAPDRWLDKAVHPDLGSSTADDLKEMSRWFWAFGSGGRMCVGSNLAILDMKAIIAGIWKRFETEVVDVEGMVHKGCYVADPKGTQEGKYCVLRVKEATT